MEPQLVDVGRVRIAGVTVRTTNAAEADPGRAAIPGLWGRFFGERLGERPGGQLLGPAAWGVYWGYEAEASGAYNVTAGVAVSDTFETDAALAVLDIEAGSYLAFHATGAAHEVVPATWGRVWEHFSRPGPLRRTYTTDFERYEGQDAVTICIAVEPSGA